MNAWFSGRSSRWSFCGERERARMVVLRGRSGTPAPIMVLARACREPTPRSCTPPHLGRMDDSALPGLMARRPSDLFSRAAAAVYCALAALSSTPPSTPLAPALRFAAGWLRGAGPQQVCAGHSLATELRSLAAELSRAAKTKSLVRGGTTTLEAHEPLLVTPCPT
jgi:hypothetical protein